MSETETETSPYELFHEIAGELSARARLLLVERKLGRRVRIRNIYYPEVQADFTARGGKVLPAVWDGERLHEGEAALALLSSL